MAETTVKTALRHSSTTFTLLLIAASTLARVWPNQPFTLPVRVCGLRTDPLTTPASGLAPSSPLRDPEDFVLLNLRTAPAMAWTILWTLSLLTDPTGKMDNNGKELLTPLPL
jgi:hypothetical protein